MKATRQKSSQRTSELVRPQYSRTRFLKRWVFFSWLLGIPRGELHSTGPTGMLTQELTALRWAPLNSTKAQSDTGLWHEMPGGGPGIRRSAQGPRSAERFQHGRCGA